MDAGDKYYTIGEISEMLGVKDSTLRYWQTEFTDLDPKRTRSNRRIYTNNDIKVIKKIMYLLIDLKYTIAGAKEELAKDNEILELKKKNKNETRDVSYPKTKEENKKNYEKLVKENINAKGNINNKKIIKEELKDILKILDNEI